MNTQPPTPRSYSVEHNRDLRRLYPGGPLTGADWTLRLSGSGHWCRANGTSGRYGSEADAERRGRLWVATGIEPSQQDRRAPVLAEAIEALAHACRVPALRRAA